MDNIVYIDDFLVVAFTRAEHIADELASLTPEASWVQNKLVKVY